MYRPKLALLLRTSLPLLAASALITACGNKDKGSPSDKDPDEGTGGMTGGMGGEPNEPPPFVPTACEEDADCDDSFYCNGEESCVDNLCRQGERVDCSDGVRCTVDRCVESEQECENEAPDEDGDGHADASCEGEDGTPLGDDCDDDDSLSYPGNTEVCDPENRDEDCNPATFGDLDSDLDGYIDAQCCNVDEDDALNCGDDCDDKKTNVNPAATEACDFLDNNCDGETDDGVSIAVYEDKDHDGRGDDEAGTVQSCAGAVGFAAIAGDCDDDDPEVFEGQFEICDDKDNNCSGEVDEVRELAPWYKDVDGDGYGDPESAPVLSCYRIPGRVMSQNDCADDESTVNPNATEICDGLDNDCNGRADFKLAGNNNFEDDDADGAADAECGGTDCNDTDSRTSGGAEEVCDRIDNDCDGEVDEQTVQNIWYIDEDGDGWGVVIGSALASCDPIPARASQFGDCDDSDREVKPGVAELCDGIDQDCDGIVDEGAAVHCDLENALSACRFGECAVFSCMPGYEDANNSPIDGCEALRDPADYVTANACTTDTECNNANLCDGIESCVAGFCNLGTPINCGAGPAVIQGNFSISSGRDILDLEGIDIITGDLTISSAALTSLVGLESLRVIGGNLYIQNNTNLRRLSGSALSNLEMVGGDVVISNNAALTSVALPSLVSANALSITNNSALTEILASDFGSLASVERLIQIESNYALETVEGFEGITRIGGAYYYAYYYGACDGGGGLEIESNALTTLDAFHALSEVGGDVCLNSNYLLQALQFHELETVGGTLAVGSSSAMETFEFPVLRTVGEDFLINSGEGGGGPVREFALPALEDVGGDLNFSAYWDDPNDPYIIDPNLSQLETISFPNLISAGTVQVNVSWATELTTLEFPSLQTTTSLSVGYSAPSAPVGIPTLTFPALASVSGSFSLYATGNVTSVSAPVLTNAGSLLVSVTSDQMESVEFPLLQSTTSDLSVTATSSNANELTSVNFGSLTQVASLGSYLNTATFDTSVASTGTLDIGALQGVGADYSGTIFLDVTPYDVCAQGGVVSQIRDHGVFAGAFSGNVPCEQ